MGDPGGFWGAGQGEEEKGLGVTENLGWGKEVLRCNRVG